MERIVLEVDEATGRAYQKLNLETRQKFNRTISLFLKKAINDADGENYRALLNTIGEEAIKNGLTPETLNELLHSDDQDCFRHQ